MAVRDFDGSDDVIDLDPGTVLDAAPTAFTIVAVYKSDSDHAGGLLCAMRDSDSAASYGINPFSDGDLYVSASGFAGEPYPDGDWILAAWGKAAGNATTRWHLFNFDTLDAWVHSDSGSVGDPTIAAPDRIRVGQWRNTSERFNGKLAALAVYDTALSDGAVEGLADGLQAMLDAAPNGLWAFNQASTATDVTDLTENGADQTAITGTSVITDDDPPGFSFELGGSELAPADALHGHTADVVTVTQRITVAAAAHAHTADAVTLTQKHVIAPASTLHAHAADQVTLPGGAAERTDLWEWLWYLEREGAL
jgi:hypothetical protein